MSSSTTSKDRVRVRPGEAVEAVNPVQRVAAPPAPPPRRRRIPARHAVNERRRSVRRSVRRVDSAPVAPRAGAASGSDLAALLRRHRAIAAVLAAYAASALIMPTMTATPVSDDWVYARSVEILLRQGELRILDLSVVTLVFQVLWGGLFAGLFGLSFGALRLSTVVLMFLSGIACYGLCRELALDRGRSALAAAAYLFNPLAFVLGFSFMTDPQFTALLVIATFFYARGLQSGETGERALLAGSMVAALAFLVRQQGALIPFAVVVYLVLSRRLRIWPHPDRRGVALFARVVAIPAVATVLYYLWLVFVHGVPIQQESFSHSVIKAGWGGSWQLIERLTVIEAMYAGFFILPIAAAAIVGLPRLWHVRTPLGWTMLAAWGALLAAGLVIFGQDGRRWPYIPQFVGVSGLGPNDLEGGGRPWVVNSATLEWLTGACAAGALLFGLALCRNVGAARTRDGAKAGLVLTVGLWQVVGVLPPSYHFRNWIISVDRYLLPLLPFVVCLGLWALRDVRLAMPIAWLGVAAFAFISIAGTRDFLVFQDATWDLARAANAAGVINTRLDAGSSWDGYHLWEYSHANRIPQRTPGGAWWTNLFAPATDSSYVVSTAPLPGYDLLALVEYSTWLDGDPTYLYLLRRWGVTGPP